jgi:hypothetical protein
MTDAAQTRDFVPSIGRNGSPWRTGSAPRRGILRRLLDALYESRQRQAEREIAAILARSGGRLTDTTEREMTRRLMGR